MARKKSASGEKPLFWIGSAKSDLLEFPEAVNDEMGIALSVAQFGGKHPKAKPWKGEGPGILEIVEDHRGDTCRVVYTVKFENAAYVLHAFQKKSPKGIETSQADVELISRRHKVASEAYKGAIWQAEEITRSSFKVQATCLRILVNRMPARSRHGCAWRLPSIRLLTHVIHRKRQRHACSTSISRRFPPW